MIAYLIANMIFIGMLAYTNLKQRRRIIQLEAELQTHTEDIRYELLAYFLAGHSKLSKGDQKAHLEAIISFNQQYIELLERE